ncbi:MAG: 2-aminoethylphosphonate--pyruvate transaminase [Arenicellales bacterium]|mgnify:FL=1|nr:2-aminoethylphosphonate--pyruvate transaminase [Acidiferrobacteraceae bacterium]MDP7563477.1 2-aminoethylphosphonate--pyruvate transaminase [Arenicellales bacterium]MEE1559429.1 2-aminoethylphosphonate--pyruvate transaminase [Arenicellales bacterium]HCV20278.1 2-aminoethylphosphonate--pyruvate transaminase [Gammaproteobacteria bacterium]HJP44522.1 2-aminoethylphosphonate--pyruvate transaminase [Arenicellales bacterium]
MTTRSPAPSAASPTGDPWLLTPGPLTTSTPVKQAMLHDYGSRDRQFIELNRQIRQRLVAIVGGSGNYTCVPLQGSGTFAVEAMLITLVPRDGKVLLLINGAYGERMARICAYHQRAFEVQTWPEDQPVDPAQVEAKLSAQLDISHIAIVHCETTSGILNPVSTVADVVQRAGRRLLIDAMSAFGALPLDVATTPFDAVVASSNKCLEGSPGMGFCIVRESALANAGGNSDSLVLDLVDQWQAMESNNQWRFTPPTHCILALGQALDEFDFEGGVTGRGGRYRANCQALVAGMRELGFKTLLPDALQAPIIVTFHMPADPNFDFALFYDQLRARGFVIYPGKLTVADSFRIGCIGRIGRTEIDSALAAVRQTLEQMGVGECGPGR